MKSARVKLGKPPKLVKGFGGKRGKVNKKGAGPKAVKFMANSSIKAKRQKNPMKLDHETVNLFEKFELPGFDYKIEGLKAGRKPIQKKSLAKLLMQGSFFTRFGKIEKSNETSQPFARKVKKKTLDRITLVKRIVQARQIQN